MLQRSYTARLKDKDNEIQRLADANKEMLAHHTQEPTQQSDEEGQEK
jgi:hypothetical protein